MEIDKNQTADHIEGWRRHLRILRGLSEKSIAVYEQKIGEFLGWLKDSGGFSQLSAITRQDIEGYLEHCFFLGNSNQTRNTKLIAISSFVRYLAYQGILSTDISADVPRPKTRRGFVPKLTKDEVIRMFKVMDIEGEKGLRDAAILILGAFGGLRSGEIINLCIGDIIADGSGPLDVNIVYSKQGASRIVSLWKAPLLVLSSWMAVRISQGACAKDPLIIAYRKGSRPKNEKLSYAGLDSWIKQMAKKAGISRPRGSIRMHMLRATHASDLRNIRGYDIAAIAERLGHKHISTTDRYIPNRQRIHKEYRSLADYWSGFGGLWTKGDNHVD